MPRSLFPALLLLLHAYIGWRLVPALPGGPIAQAALIGVLLVSLFLLPLGLFARAVADRGLGDRLAWAGLTAMGLFSSLFVFTLLRDVLLLGWALWPQPDHYGAAAEWSAGAVPLLALAASLIGFVNARRLARVVTVEVPLAGLPAALEGFVIAQISDVHVGPTIKRPYIEAIVGAVNALKPDLVAITGDLVDGPLAHLQSHTAPLAGLAARHGVYMVTGNHEYYSGEPAWTQEFRRLGMHVLKNEHVLLRHDGAPLLLAGVTDYSAHHFDPEHPSDPRAALAGAPADCGPKILLAHQPRSAQAAAEAHFDLQLSGHTHGGQFWPWNFFVRLQQPFTAGLHRLGNLWVYTSRGTGYWGPPKRVAAPSEITLIRLVRAPA